MVRAASLFLFFALLPSCNSGNFQAEESFSFALDRSDKKTLQISTHNGSINVKRGGEKVIVSAEVSVSAPTLQQAAELLATVFLDGGNPGTKYASTDILDLEFQSPKENLGISASFTLEVPEDMALALDTSNGRVNVEGEFPLVNIVTSNGGISFTGSAKTFDFKTSNGKVHLSLPDKWDGNGTVKTSNGKILVEYPKELHAKVNAKTSNGEVKAQFSSDGPGKLNLRTSNGKITCIPLGN
jgi:DUF4097 and DUF4098 domain-containing protein YvlB